MKDNVVAVSIGIVCTIAVLATVLIPAIDGYSQTHETIVNDGYFEMTVYDVSEDHTAVWTYENPNVLTVDDADVTIDYTVASSYVPIVFGTNFIIRYGTDSAGDPATVSFIGPSSGAKTASVANGHSVTFTFSGGTCTADFGGSNVFTSTYEDLYLPSNDGVLTLAPSAYLNADSEIFGGILSNISTSTSTITLGAGVNVEGSYTDGLTCTVWRPTSGVTVSDISADIVQNTHYVDIYELSSITATATYSETVDEETVTTDTALVCNYFLVPVEVTSELSIHLTDVEITLISVIPLLGVLALVLGCAYTIFRNRDY